MKASRTIAAATGVLIGLGAIAPAAAVPQTVAAKPGNGWGVQQARQEFRADLREARQEFRADVREARQQFRMDIREMRQEDRARFQEAKQALREALKTARDAFHNAISAANETFRATASASRDTLLAVLQDPASTAEQRDAAIAVYKDEMLQARAVRHEAVMAAIVDYKAARAAAREAFKDAIDQG